MKISERGLRIIFVAFLNGDQCHFLKTVLSWKKKTHADTISKVKKVTPEVKPGTLGNRDASMFMCSKHSGVVLLWEFNQWIIKQTCCYSSEVDYFPIIARPQVFHFSSIAAICRYIGDRV